MARRPATSVPDRLPPWRAPLVWQLAALLVASIALGGGGVAYAWRNLAIQALALAILWLNRPALVDFIRHAPRAVLALVALTLALPLAQLVPLPPALWQALPGRAVVIEARMLAGLPADAWLPLSLDRGRTLTAFVGLFAPAVLVVLGARLPPAGKARLVQVLVLAALGALLLGAVQLASANTSGLLFPVDPRPDVLYATFANRNSTALFLVLALVLLAVVPLPAGAAWRLGAVAAGALLALAALLTQSRSGMALLGVALAFVALRSLLAWRGRKRASGAGGQPQPPGWVAVAGTGLALALVAAVAGSALAGGRAADALERLAGMETDRPQIWEDAAHAARQYWPAGSGMGTFDEVFQLHESLEYVSPREAGRAHSDWLELAIEAGPAGLALALGWLAWALFASLSAPPAQRWWALGAGLALGLIALQSLLDYPLRNQTLLCVAALAVVLLVHKPGAARP